MPLFYNHYFYKNSITHWKLRELLQTVLWAFRYLLVACYFIITSTNFSIYFTYMGFARKKLTRNKKKNFGLLKAYFWNTKRQKRELSLRLHVAKRVVSRLSFLQSQISTGAKDARRWLPLLYKYTNMQGASSFLAYTAFYTLKNFPYRRGQRSLRLSKIENPSTKTAVSGISNHPSVYNKAHTLHSTLLSFPYMRGKKLAPFFYKILSERFLFTASKLQKSRNVLISSFLKWPFLSKAESTFLLISKSKVKPSAINKNTLWLSHPHYLTLQSSVKAVAHTLSPLGLYYNHKYISKRVQSELKPFKVNWGHSYLKLIEQGENMPLLAVYPLLNIKALLSRSEVQRRGAAYWVNVLTYNQPDKWAFVRKFYKEHISQFLIPSLVGDLAMAHKESLLEARGLVDDALRLYKGQSSAAITLQIPALTVPVNLPRRKSPLLLHAHSRSKLIYAIYRALYPYSLERQIAKEYTNYKESKGKLHKFKIKAKTLIKANKQKLWHNKIHSKRSSATKKAY